MSSTSLASPVTSAKVLSASALVAAALCSQQVGEDGKRWWRCRTSFNPSHQNALISYLAILCICSGEYSKCVRAQGAHQGILQQELMQSHSRISVGWAAAHPPSEQSWRFSQHHLPCSWPRGRRQQHCPVPALPGESCCWPLRWSGWWQGSSSAPPRPLSCYRSPACQSLRGGKADPYHMLQKSLGKLLWPSYPRLCCPDIGGMKSKLGSALPIAHLMINKEVKRKFPVPENAYIFSLKKNKPQEHTKDSGKGNSRASLTTISYCWVTCHTEMEEFTPSASSLPFRLLRMVLASCSVPLLLRAASSARAFAASARAKSWSAVWGDMTCINAFSLSEGQWCGCMKKHC